MKFISPGGWFSLEYPGAWSEFEDSEGTVLFYNPNKWCGNECQLSLLPYSV